MIYHFLAGDKHFVHHKRQLDLSRDMTKPTKWLCAQQRLSLRCPHEESLGS